MNNEENEFIADENGAESLETALAPIENEEESPALFVDEEPSGNHSQNGSPWLRPSTVIIGLIIFALIGFLLNSFFGTPSEANQANIVKDYPVVSDRFATEDFQKLLNKLKNTPQAERAKFLQDRLPTLHNDVLVYAIDSKIITPTDRVSNVGFWFGSQSGLRATDGAGAENFGKFEDQLVARLTIDGKDKSIDVIVYCLNGTFGLPADLEMISVREPNLQFTIGPKQGLTAFVSMPTAIDLAKRFNLKLYRGKVIAEKHRISPEVARQLNTDNVQVTVLVVEGDFFDLQKGEFKKSPKRNSAD